MHLKGMKAPIGLMSMVTSLAGFLAAHGKITAVSIGASCGVGLVTTGALLLNNIQDRDLDLLMERTRERPIPANKMRPPGAAILSFTFISAGCWTLLYTTGSAKGFLFSIAALILYNLLYTPLKRITSYAVLPGIISGSMPLYIGWISGGGAYVSARILFLMTLMSIWQLPHTWIINLSNRHDYQAAKIPTMASMVAGTALHRLIFLWIFTFAAATLWIPLLGITVSPVSEMLIAANALVLVLVFLYLMIIKNDAPRYRLLFNYLNISVGVLFIIIIGDIC